MAFCELHSFVNELKHLFNSYESGIRTKYFPEPVKLDFLDVLFFS